MYRMLIRESWLLSLKLGGLLREISFLSRPLRGDADTPARITGDGYKNDREVNNNQRHSGMDVDPSGKNNHSGPGRGGDHSQEPKRLSWGKPYKSLKWQQEGPEATLLPLILFLDFFFLRHSFSRHHKQNLEPNDLAKESKNNFQLYINNVNEGTSRSISL